MEAEDAIATWIGDRCELDPLAWTSSTELFGSWVAWANAAGEKAGSQKRFTQTLESHGFRRHKTRDAQGFYGLRVRLDGTPQHDGREVQ
jgi:hypothetical protein